MQKQSIDRRITEREQEEKERSVRIAQRHNAAAEIRERNSQMIYDKLANLYKDLYEYWTHRPTAALVLWQTKDFVDSQAAYCAEQYQFFLETGI